MNPPPMATAFALLESYSSFKESLQGAAEKARVAADKVRGAVVEQTKGAMVRAKSLAGPLLNPDQTELLSPLQGVEEGQGGAAQQAQQPKSQQKQQSDQREQGAQAQAEESSQLLDELNQACNLTFKQRVYGFAGCLSLGFLCCILSLFVLFHPVKFGLAYSFGNLLSLGSTGFLIGFKRQLTMMLDPVRRVAAIVFVTMCFVTLLVAILIRDPLLTLVCIIVQGSALLWYSLSYIPYAQATAKRLARLFMTAEF